MIKSKLKYLVICILSMFLATFSASASTYTPTTNLFEGTYPNNLIDMGMTQINKFVQKKYLILQSDYNYYLITGDDVVVDGTTITFTDSKIISAIRNSSGGYNTYYTYSTYTESSTTVYANYTVISNIDTSMSVASKRLKEYRFGSNVLMLLTFILAFAVGLFMLKGSAF